MRTIKEQRLNFLNRLEEMTEKERFRLLEIENLKELVKLREIALDYRNVHSKTISAIIINQFFLITLII